MTDPEERLMDGIDRLGGKSRLAKLEEQCQGLAEEVQQLKQKLENEAVQREMMELVVPGVDLVGLPEGGSWEWVDTSGINSSPAGSTFVLLGVGSDWVVVRDKYGTDTLFCVHTNMRTELSGYVSPTI